MASKKLNSKSTKAELLSAYKELIQEKKELESQLQAAPKASVTMSSQPPVPAIAEPQLPANSTTSPSAAQDAPDLGVIIHSLGRLQLDFGSAASQLSEQLTAEVIKLQDVQSLVTQESRQLQALHDLDFTDQSLSTLIETYQTDAKAFAQELSEQRETLERNLAQAEKDWAQERTEHQRQVQMRNQQQAKLGQRDRSEYTYDLTLQRKLSDDEYEQTQAQRYQALDELQTEQEKQWAEREKAIAQQEQDFETLKTKVEAFPDELEKALKKAKEEGKGIAQHQAKIKADLVAQEVQGQTRTYELRVETLQDTLDDQAERIQSLSSQLESALKQVQDLAVKAIEGAANFNSLKSIREIAIEQAKTPSKNK